MFRDTEIFYLKADTDSGIEGLVLKNRSDNHYGTSGLGLLHDLWEHTYKPIANPYLDEIAALGAFNEYRMNEQNGDILRELRYIIADLHEAYLDGRIRLKWDCNKYKYIFEYYFQLGISTFNSRFDSYFNSYWDLYYDLGETVTNKLNPLVSSGLDNIKLTINYKNKEVKVE